MSPHEPADALPLEARFDKIAKAAWDAAAKHAPTVYTTDERTAKVEGIGRVAAALIALLGDQDG